MDLCKRVNAEWYFGLCIIHCDFTDMGKFCENKARFNFFVKKKKIKEISNG